jgi:isopentenyldiphosphate isomerase
MPAQDLTEPFDLVDADGAPLGVVKPRGLVHRDGDWHQSVHLWVVFDGASPHVLLQRRAYDKDTHPGRVDVSVAGHLRAGESPRDGLREAEEEVGLVVRPEDCVALGLRRSAYVGEGFADREIQHVFLVRTSVAFEALRPHPEEVAGLVLAPLDGLRALVATGEPLAVIERDHAGTRAARLTREALVATGDGYAARVLATIARRCAGVDEGYWRLGW